MLSFWWNFHHWLHWMFQWHCRNCFDSDGSHSYRNELICIWTPHKFSCINYKQITKYTITIYICLKDFRKIYILEKCTLYKKLRLKLPYRTYTFRQHWSYLPETHRSRFISQLVQHYSESFIMTSSNGNIFRVTPRSALLEGNSLVTGEFPAQRLVTRGFDVFFDLRLNQRLSKQSWVWWFGTLSCSLWRHCNVICIWTPHTSLVASTRNKSRSIRTIHRSLDDFKQIYI